MGDDVKPNPAFEFETRVREAAMNAMQAGIHPMMVTGILHWIADDVRETVMESVRAKMQSNHIIKPKAIRTN